MIGGIYDPYHVEEPTPDDNTVDQREGSSFGWIVGVTVAAVVVLASGIAIWIRVKAKKQ